MYGRFASLIDLWSDTKTRRFIELAFNFQQPIIFTDAIRPCRRTGFDLPCIERHRDICYGSILCLPAPVGKNRAISVGFCKCKGNYSKKKKGRRVQLFPLHAGS